LARNDSERISSGGQTVLTAATEQLMLDQLCDGAWLTELGTHPLRDIPRPERVMQLCHPDLPVAFPPLRSSKPPATLHLPVQLTSLHTATDRRRADAVVGG
jgi:hypothetical protein